MSDSRTLKQITTAVQTLLNDEFDAALYPDGDPGKNTMRAVERVLQSVVDGREATERDPGRLLVLQRMLPEFCYSWRELADPTGVCVHYVSACYTAPDDWADIDTIVKQTIDLNRDEDEREFYPKVTGGRTQRVWASYHYLIGVDGDVWQLTPTDRQAYHAGKSEFAGRAGCNAWSIGVALVADERDVAYSDEQYTALAALLDQLRGEFNIEHVFGHDECAVPAGRKQDPGPRFEWHRVR